MPHPHQRDPHRLSPHFSAATGRFFFSEDEAERILQVAIEWGCYAELFADEEGGAASSAWRTRLGREDAA